jgi:RecB family exonuclease
MSVASAIADDHERERVDRITPASDRLVGTLVHRLLQRAGGDELATSGATRERAARLLRHDEVEESDDVDALIDGAVDAYAAIRAREDVRVLYAAGRTLHEVPFTMTIDGRILRGTVDCLVETPPGRFTILEFKTGRKRPEHQAQVDLYLYAMRQVFPDSLIDARLIYA